MHKVGTVSADFLPIPWGDIELVELLLEHGTDLDIDDSNGGSPRKLCQLRLQGHRSGQKM